MAEQHVQVMSPDTRVEVASTGVTVVLGGGVDPDALAAHARDSTDVHGIADTAALVRTDDPRLSDARPPVDAFNGMGSGRGVTSIADDDRDGTATVTYTDGTTSPLPLPAGPTGPKGDPGNPGPYILRGTGSPLGTVTPSAVGVTYTDYAATNGARVWISTGTTSSAWTVMNGDTGLRYLVNTVDAGVGKIDKVTIQRINNTVYVNFEGGSTMDALTLSTGEIAALPTGWRSSVTGVIATVHQDGAAVGQMIAYNGNSVRVITSAGAWRKGALIFPTTDPWPTSLPGTP